MRRKSRKAIALEYGDNPVPVLTAKGDGEMAKAIIEEAERLGIHIAEDTNLVALLRRGNPRGGNLFRYFWTKK